MTHILQKAFFEHVLVEKTGKEIYVLFSCIVKKDLGKIADFVIGAPADHAYGVCHLLGVYAVGGHAGIVFVWACAHDQKVGYTRFLHLICQLLGQLIVEKLGLFVIHVLALDCLQNQGFFVG